MYSWFRDRPLAQYALLAALLFFLFAWVQAPATFPDPDSFYHTKMALLMARGDVTPAFSSLPYTTLQTAWADHHFLYHLLLVPFLYLFPAFLGVKVATVLLAVAALLFLFFFLRHEQVQGAFLYVLLLALLEPFAFRMSLVKAPSLSLIFVFLILFFLFRGRSIPLFFLSWLFVLSYGGWPLLFLLFGAWSVGTCVQKISSGVKVLRALRPLLVPFVAIFFGSILGMVTHPYFPNNFTFFWNQIVDIAIVNYRHVIQVGAEWYGYSFFDFLAAAPIAFSFVLVSLVLFALTFRSQDNKAWALFFLTGFFFVATIASRRHIEYFIPFGMMFSAFVLTRGSSANVLRIRNVFLSFMYSRAKQFPIAAGAIFVYFFLTLTFLLARDVSVTRWNMERGFSLAYFAGVGQWLTQALPAGSVVFHSDWDEFPMLFFWNSNLRYIAGLDPTFFYLKDRQRYALWREITEGTFTGDLAATIRGTFRSSVVVIAKRDHLSMHQMFERDQRFTRAYEDDDVWVYRLP